MRLLFQKKRWAVCNRIKYCIKYYSQYFALSCVALAAFLGFGIFRAWAGGSSGFILRASLRELLRFIGYPALVLCILVSYEVVVLILKFYQREEGVLRYAPVRRLDILLTELLTVTAAAVCIILVPTSLTLMSLHLTAAFWGQLFLALAVLVGTMILLPVFSYQFLVIQTGKRLLFTPYLILLQVLLTIQHGMYVMGEGTVLYACLLAMELVILLLAVAGVVKRPDQIRFYGRKKSLDKEKKEWAGRKGMGQGRLIWIEVTRNMGMLLQFILIPVVLLVFGKLWGDLLFERYVYYYMAFIPCFFAGLSASYREVYQLTPIKLGYALFARFVAGILIMLAVELPLYALLGMVLSIRQVGNGILFAAVMYLCIGASGMKLLLDGQENPSYYLVLVAFQYAYSTLLLYVQEFSFMGFGVALREETVSLVFFLVAVLIFLTRRGRRLR